MQLLSEGQSLPEIRRAVDATWGDQGPSTDTPYPPDQF